MRTIVNSRGMLAGLALLAAAGMTACSANRTPSSTGPDNAQMTAPAASAAASRAASPAAAIPSATPTGIQNLVITGAEKSQLTATFMTFKGIPLSDIAGAGPTPGSVYYAYDPATDTHWALADFESSTTAPFDVMVNFQDGGSMGMYRQTGAGAWQVQLGGVPPWCTESKFFPRTVLTTWSISAPTGLTC